MNGIYKPSEADLTPLLHEATGQGKVTEEAWRAKLLLSFAGILKKKPLTYRTFGPYWWLMKPLLLEQGENAFGTAVDTEWREKLDYGSPTFNLLAAYAYYDTAFEQGLLYSSTHMVSSEDGESTDYVLIDEEMETLALMRM